MENLTQIASRRWIGDFRRKKYRPADGLAIFDGKISSRRWIGEILSAKSRPADGLAIFVRQKLSR